jgi:hypothetical protein
MLLIVELHYKADISYVPTVEKSHFYRYLRAITDSLLCASGNSERGSELAVVETTGKAYTQ